MKFLAILSLAILLASCGSIHSNKISFTQAKRDQWHPLAQAGDAEAQYQLGNAWCCGQGGFFSTKEAIRWWCRASNQGHFAAQQALHLRKAAHLCKS